MTGMPLKFWKECGFGGEAGHFAQSFQVVLRKGFLIMEPMDYVVDAMSVDEMVEVFFKMNVEQLR